MNGKMEYYTEVTQIFHLTLVHGDPHCLCVKGQRV